MASYHISLSELNKGEGIKGSKTKKSSNKNKECTFVVGAIVKLIKQGGASSSNVGANAAMILLRQMERMSNSMDEHDRQDKKEKEKERKHHKKQCAKKKAKRKAKRKAKKAKKK